MKYYLAIDIGASSGRHIIGFLNEQNKLILEEVYRFKNGVITSSGHLIWDIDYLFKEVKKGIQIALEKYPHIQSLSIDTWGVDYVLMNGDQEIKPCYSYRDTRCKVALEMVHHLIPFNELYEITGCQFQEFNTIYQLYDDLINKRLDQATDFLMIPEYLIYKLTSIKVKEYTNASTTGLLSCKTNDYSKDIIERLHFKQELFKPLQKQGYVVGDLTPEVQKEVNGNIKVVLCSTHDTASAVEGIPMHENAPYISSGTWSLLGIKLDHAINSPLARKANYSNEYGPTYIRFQKNIMGLWIIQCLSKQMNLDYPEMVEISRKSNYRELYDVNDSSFLSALNMKEAIISWFNERGIKPPLSNEDIINATYRSLADSYRIALHELEKITKKEYKYLYIVGGGAKNQYLNELAEKFTNKKVIALPLEATSCGNIIAQIKGEQENEK